MYTSFYFVPTTAAYTATQIAALIGFDPTGVGVLALNQMKVYPVTNPTDPYDSRFYTGSSITGYTVSGTTATATWTATPIASVSTAKTLADSGVKKAFGAYATTTLGTDLGTTGLIAIASIASASRGSEFATPFTTMATAGGILQDQMAGITAATTVDTINDVINPPATITGTLKLTRSSNNLTGGEMPALSGTVKTKLSLVLPNATIQGVDAAVVFPAATSCWSGSPFSWTLKFGVYTIGSGVASSGEADYAISWTPPVPPLAINQ